MNKITLIAIVAACFFASDLMAQGIGVGIKGGLNFANQDIDGVNTDSRTGFHFGGYARINLAAGFGVQPEAFFSAQGSDISVATATQEVKSNYIQVPILVRKSFANIVNIHAGPQFGILLSNELDGNDIKDQAKSSDVSLAIGAGIDLPFGVNGAIRYVRGLTDINDAAGGSEIKNSMFQISIGYDLFSIGND